MNNELYKIPVPEREQNIVGLLRLSSRLIELHKSPLLSMLTIITVIPTKINNNYYYLGDLESHETDAYHFKNKIVKLTKLLWIHIC